MPNPIAEGFNALLWTDLMKIACEIGFAPPVLVDVAPVPIDHFDSELIQLLGDYKIIIFIKCIKVLLFIW